MKSFYTLLFIVLTFSLKAQPPAGYYNAAEGLTGVQLQSVLHNIIDGHSAQSYSSLHQHFESTDIKADATVWDMYSDNPNGNPPYIYHFIDADQCGNYGGEGDCYNREHSWPKSWFDDKMPMYSDLFHLYPTDGYVNGRRSNYPYGEVSNATWTSRNGCKLGPCSFQGYSGTVFEPIDEYKGDLARTYFYMSVRYYGEDNGWPGSEQTTGSQLKPWALKLMLNWNQQDPVSEKEIDRNNAVYDIQNNRNPFIDHPEFAISIWDSSIGFEDQIVNSNITVYPIPANDFCIIAHKGYYNIDKVVITVADITGRVFDIKYTVTGQDIKLETSNMLPGFYIISVNQEGKYPAFARIVK